MGPRFELDRYAHGEPPAVLTVFARLPDLVITEAERRLTSTSRFRHKNAPRLDERPRDPRCDAGGTLGSFDLEGAGQGQLHTAFDFGSLVDQDAGTNTAADRHWRGEPHTVAATVDAQGEALDGEDLWKTTVERRSVGTQCPGGRAINRSPIRSRQPLWHGGEWSSAPYEIEAAPTPPSPTSSDFLRYGNGGASAAIRRQCLGAVGGAEAAARPAPAQLFQSVPPSFGRDQ
jgi:hypothetical protein